MSDARGGNGPPHCGRAVHGSPAGRTTVDDHAPGLRPITGLRCVAGLLLWIACSPGVHGATIHPGPSWNGTITWPGRTPPADPVRSTFKPVAHFGAVPYQDVTGDFAVPVIAYAKGGIEKVTFWCEGHEVEVTTPIAFDEYEGRPFEAYVGVLDAEQFPIGINGPFDVFATVTPADKSAQSRVIALRLFRDAGTAPATVKYVGPQGTDDAAARRGDSAGNPYKTIRHAKEQINRAQAGDVGGGRIKLLAGAYVYGADPENVNRAAANRWLTIEPAEGVDHSEVSLTSQGSGSGLRTAKVRLSRLTIDQTARWTVSSTGPLDDALWADACVVRGPGRTVDQSQLWHPTAWSERYITDCDVSGYRDGPVGARFARNVVLGDLGSDAFQNVKCSIVCDLRSIDKSGTDFHPDVWQVRGENNLLYGLNAGPAVSAQGVFLKDADTADTAVVDCRFEYTTRYHSQARGKWSHSHVLLLNNTWPGQHWFVDGEGPREHWEVRNNVFQTATLDAVAPALGRNRVLHKTPPGKNPAAKPKGRPPGTRPKRSR